MVTSVAAVTVNGAVPFFPVATSVAVIVAVPVANAVATPSDPIVAIAVFEELQVTDAARSSLESSVKIPVAMNCCVVPFAIL